MAFDAASLLQSLFPAPLAALPRPKPEASVQSLSAALGTRQPPRAVNRLPRALPTPPLPEWLLSWKRAPELTPPPKPCYWCGRSVFWLSNFGTSQEGYKCGHCHPPSFPELVQMWVRVVPTEGGPQVVRLGTPPSKE